MFKTEEYKRLKERNHSLLVLCYIQTVGIVLAIILLLYKKIPLTNIYILSAIMSTVIMVFTKSVTSYYNNLRILDKWE